MPSGRKVVLAVCMNVQLELKLKLKPSLDLSLRAAPRRA